MDEYQKNYLEHQKKKAEVMKKIIEERHSDRMFEKDDIDEKPIIDSILKAPTSCNRKAIKYSIVTEKENKSMLSGLLVGGTGWLHRANKIILLFADSIAYKGKDEIKYMPYLDAGVAIGQAYLQATANDIGICYVNPNTQYKDLIIKKFGKKNYIFCGAIALGKKKGK